MCLNIWVFSEFSQPIDLNIAWILTESWLRWWSTVELAVPSESEHCLRKPRSPLFFTGIHGIKLNLQIFSLAAQEFSSFPQESSSAHRKLKAEITENWNLVWPNWKSVIRTRFLWEKLSLCGFRNCLNWMEYSTLNSNFQSLSSNL